LFGEVFEGCEEEEEAGQGRKSPDFPQEKPCGNGCGEKQGNASL